MARDSATGNTLPICSPCVCQMIGVYTPRPLRDVCHGVTSYISITARSPRPASPQTPMGTCDGHVRRQGLCRDRWRRRLRLCETFLIFRSIPPPPSAPPAGLLPSRPSLRRGAPFCCPINHTSLINRPTVPSLPTVPAPHLAQPCCPAGMRRMPVHMLIRTYRTELEHSWHH